MPTEYDERQLFLMRKQIEGFEEGVLLLPDLVFRLEALLCFLQSVDPEWQERFEAACTNLEICNATTLSDGQLSEQARVRLTRHVAILKDLLDQLSKP
jgi:hypothetical protein